jgi:NitT/TauT family transport system permease protein
VERPLDRAAEVTWAKRRGVLLVAVFALLWGLWEGIRALGIHFGWQHPFTIDATSMPHIHDMIHALFLRPNPQAPLLVVTLLKAAAFTGREAALGFGMGAVGGFVIGAVLAHSRMLQRGMLPYVVASQTIPILAIAPMVVIWLASVHVTAWVSVAVIAAYLTFFPVAINTLRGLHSPDPRALELMRSYAAGRWRILWRLRVPASLPYVFSALKISATACVIGAIIGETPASLQGGLGYAIVNFNQYYSTQPANLWATIIACALLGITFFLAIVLLERLVLKRAPEHVA